MIEFTEEQIKEAFEKTEPVIQEILLDSWITNDLSLIAKSLKIRIDKTDIIIKIVGYVILNLIPLSRMSQTIEKETGFDKERSMEITKKIDEIVFAKIRQIIKERNLKEDSGKTEEEFYANKDIKTFSDILEENKNTEKVKKVIDPYREMT